MAKGGFPMGGMNMQQMMMKAQRMQQEIQKKQQELLKAMIHRNPSLQLTVSQKKPQMRPLT